MTDQKQTLFGSFVAWVRSMCGWGQSAASANSTAEDPALFEEIPIRGFDAEGEPVIKKWADGSLWIHFSAMPPFFAEDAGTEAEFENFEVKIQEALGVAVIQDDRELFVILKPQADTVEKAKAWLEGYRNKGA